jgi:hypothetical protein
MPLTPRENIELQRTIEDAVAMAIKRTLPNTDKLRFEQLEKKVQDNNIILTGNGHPEDGLIVKVDRLILMMRWMTAAIWTIAGAFILFVLNAVLVHIFPGVP